MSIILCVVLGFAASAIALYLTPRTFKATATGYVSVTPASSTNGADASNYWTGAQLANQKSKAYTSVVTSKAVAELVIGRLVLNVQPSDLVPTITATTAANSPIITVTAVANDADLARRIADSLIEVSAEKVRELEGAESPVKLTLLASANLSDVERSPSVSRYLSIGILGGLVCGYGLAVVRSMLDRRVRSLSEIQELTDVPIVGVLPQSEAIARDSDVALESDFQAAEAVRKLRTNLRYARVDERFRICLVTSPMPTEGKSSVAVQLARVMALAGENVLLVDADLRRPTVQKTLGTSNPIGLTQVLAKAVPLERAVTHTSVEGMYVLPAGGMPPNPSELLGSKRMQELLESLARKCFVIVDAPPTLPVTDAALLSASADGVLLVLRAGKSSLDDMTSALDSIERAGGNTVGIVLNRLPMSKVARLQYGDEYAAMAGPGDYQQDSK